MSRQHDKSERSGFSEHDIIARYFRPLTSGVPGAHELIDDAASIHTGGECDLVVTTDALVANVHFFADDDPADIAYKALAVNISDLAAKAAAPLAYSLALILPRNTSESWIAGFAAGLGEAQAAWDIGLSGGDTTVSPDGLLAVSVSAFGIVPEDAMLLRSGGKAGDALYVTGTIGDSGLGLKLRLPGSGAEKWPLDEAGRRFLTGRYLRPEPRLALRKALLAHATAAMDISDGLAIDTSRLAAASGLRARIEASSIPLSPAAGRLVSMGAERIETILTSGDDYEILAAVPPHAERQFIALAADESVPVTRVGTLAIGDGLEVITADGGQLQLEKLGYDHFCR